MGEGGGDAADDDEEEAAAPSSSSPDDCAIKHLSPSVLLDPGKLVSGAVELVLEAKALTSLCHRNIVRLRGFSAGCVSAAFSSPPSPAGPPGFFLVLDRIRCTLEERLDQWRDQERRQLKGLASHRRKGRLRGPGGGGGGRRRESRALRASYERAMLLRRLRAAHGAASGLEYMHSRRVAHRDLRPGTVGFDSGGTVKLFDLGRAREMFPGGGEDSRWPTGMAGMVPYMAPEVFRCERYGVSADIYSFGILLWEMCTLKRPFKKLSTHDVEKKVYRGDHARPRLDSSWPASVQYLLQRCWDDDATKRPGFEGILAMIQGDMALGCNDQWIDGDETAEP